MNQFVVVDVSKIVLQKVDEKVTFFTDGPVQQVPDADISFHSVIHLKKSGKVNKLLYILELSSADQIAEFIKNLLVIIHAIVVLNGGVVDNKEGQPVESKTLQSSLGQFGGDQVDGISVQLQVPDELEEGQCGDLVVVSPNHPQTLHGVDFIRQTFNTIVTDTNFLQEGKSNWKSTQHVIIK